MLYFSIYVWMKDPKSNYSEGRCPMKNVWKVHVPYSRPPRIEVLREALAGVNRSIEIIFVLVTHKNRRETIVQDVGACLHASCTVDLPLPVLYVSSSFSNPLLRQSYVDYRRVYATTVEIGLMM
jgi:hypothetical protein